LTNELWGADEYDWVYSIGEELERVEREIVRAERAANSALAYVYEL
jgi:hypothetical protein